MMIASRFRVCLPYPPRPSAPIAPICVLTPLTVCSGSLFSTQRYTPEGSKSHKHPLTTCFRIHFTTSKSLQNP